MFRVIEHLDLVKGDLRDNILDKTVENAHLEEMILECEDHLEVKKIKKSFASNNDVINDSRAALKEVDEAIEILKVCLEDKKKTLAWQQ